MDKPVVTLDSTFEEIAALEFQLQHRAADIVRLRFRQGCLMKDVIGSYDRGVIRKAAETAKVSVSMVYKAHAFARRFFYQIEHLNKDIENQIGLGHEPSFRYYLQAVAKVDKNPGAYESEEEHKQHLLAKAEGGAQAMNAAKELYGDDPEVVGTSKLFDESLIEGGNILLGNRGRSGLLYEEVWVNEDYRAWVRARGCCVTGALPAEFHHVTLRSRGNQASDLFGIPLCTDLHREYHRIGHEKFEQRYKINIGQIMAKQLQEYIIFLQENARF